MRGRTSIFSRLLTAFVAVMPLLAGADVCTVGALTGRGSPGCPLESAAPACHVAADAAPACPHCAPAAPAAPRHETPRPARETCCGLRPEAPGTALQPALDAPAPSAHPALTGEVADAVLLVTSRAVAVSDDGRAPPADPPTPLSPRAPPQA